MSARSFDLSGGALCLDFVNTLEDRPARQPRERLETYADLVAFAASASLPTVPGGALLAEAARNPADAEAALEQARTVREALYRLFRAMAASDSVPAGDLATLNRALGSALARARLVEPPDRPPPGPLGWGWFEEPISLDLPLWPIVRSAADLLTSPTLSALRVCASDACDWLFLDASRNGSRRWCSMQTCGNRAKARRHHARVRAANSDVSSTLDIRSTARDSVPPQRGVERPLSTEAVG